jgi:hypothetical protein
LDGGLEPGRIGVEQEGSPDAPQRRRGLFQQVGALLRRLRKALLNSGLLEPGPRLRYAGRSGDGSEGAEPYRVTQQPLVGGGRLETERPVQQVRSLGPDAKGRSLQGGRGAGRPGSERIASQECREFVGGRERVRRLADRGRLERGDGTFGGRQARQPLRQGHGVNGPMPIDEVRATGGRRGEERM